MNQRIVKLIFKLLVIIFISISLEISADDTTEKKSIQDLIDRYFATWSNQDMEGYKSCFHPSAMIHFEINGEVKEENLSPFIESQRKAHALSLEKMKEIPVSKKIQFEQNTAHVIVRWKLTSTSREQYGFDYFTLIKYKNKWRIIYLIFHND